MKLKKIIVIFNLIFLSGILSVGCSTLQTKIVDIDKGSFDIQNNHHYPISNVHIVEDSGELFLKGSVSHRHGKSPLSSGHVDIAFLNSDGAVKTKECIFFDNHRSYERQANFEMPITNDLLASSKIKISYIPKKK